MVDISVPRVYDSPMTRPLPLFPPLALLAATLLPSCMYWHTGDRLRDPHTTYTGVDIYHPVDGKIHYSPKAIDQDRTGKPITEAYVIANEVTYNKRSCTGNTDDLYPIEPWANNLRPTGRQVIARIDGGGFAEEVTSLPRGLKSMDAPKEDLWSKGDGVFYMWMAKDDPKFGKLGSTAKPVETQPGWWRRRAINCCDYFVDPLLTVVTNTVAFTVTLATMPLALPANLICSQQQQQQWEEERREKQKKEEEEAKAKANH